MKNATGTPQRVLVVGATSDIDAEACRRWASLGADDFYLIGRDAPRLAALSDELAAIGASAETAIVDAHDHPALDAAVEAAVATADVDVTLIALGLLGDQSEAEASPTSVASVVDVNVTATLISALRVAAQIETQRHGAIVFLSSVAGLRGRRDNYVYGSTKAAVESVAEGMSQRLAEVGGHVCVVRPGFVRTRMTEGMAEAPFATDPGRVADDIVRAVADRRPTTFSPGILKVLFALFRLMPRWVWGQVVRRST